MTKKENVVLYVMGVSGCGKTTIGKKLSEKYDIPFFDGDDYHPKKNIDKMSSGRPLNDDDRQEWLATLNALAITQLKEETGAIIACSALKEKYRTTLTKEIETKATFVYLQGSFEDISNRLSKRKGHFMPAGLLQSQFEILEEPQDAITISIHLTPEEAVSAIGKALP